MKGAELKKMTVTKTPTVPRKERMKRRKRVRTKMRIPPNLLPTTVFYLLMCIQ